MLLLLLLLLLSSLLLQYQLRSALDLRHFKGLDSESQEIRFLQFKGVLSLFKKKIIKNLILFLDGYKLQKICLQGEDGGSCGLLLRCLLLGFNFISAELCCRGPGEAITAEVCLALGFLSHFPAFLPSLLAACRASVLPLFFFLPPSLPSFFPFSLSLIGSKFSAHLRFQRGTALQKDLFLS